MYTSALSPGNLSPAPHSVLGSSFLYGSFGGFIKEIIQRVAGLPEGLPDGIVFHATTSAFSICKGGSIKCWKKLIYCSLKPKLRSWAMESRQFSFTFTQVCK